MITFSVAAQDTAKAATVDSAARQTSQPAGEEFRTPQNGQFAVYAYTVAGVIYVSYIILLRRRWSALRKRYAQNAGQTPR